MKNASVISHGHDLCPSQNFPLDFLSFLYKSRNGGRERGREKETNRYVNRKIGRDIRRKKEGERERE